MMFIVSGIFQQLLKMNAISVHVGDNLVGPVDCIHNLGFFMDQWLKNTSHTNKITSTLYLSLLNINKIRDKLDFDSVKTMVQLSFCQRWTIATFTMW